MNAEDVARYLKEHPDFFNQYADLLAQIYVPHPHGGHAIALADRQLLTLREKNRALELKLAELIQFGEENDAISEKMHRINLPLLSAPVLEGFLSGLYFNLQEDFAIPHSSLRVWGGMHLEQTGERPELRPVSTDLKNYAASLVQPYCGPVVKPEVAAWLGEAGVHVRSVACMALREAGAGGSEGVCIGMLALASEDATRFYPEMGTLYLKRLGELVSAGLARFI